MKLRLPTTPAVPPRYHPIYGSITADPSIPTQDVLLIRTLKDAAFQLPSGEHTKSY